jgi:hypothetical protein
MAKSAKIKLLTKGAETRLHGAISGSQIIREIGNSWSEIRIGISTNLVGDISIAPPYGTRLFIGVCSGNTNCIGDDTVAHALGWATVDPALSPIRWATNRWARANAGGASTGTYYLYTSGIFSYGAKFVGSNLTPTAVSGTMGGMYVFGDIGDSTFANYIRTCLWVNIQKGSPNFTFTEYGYPGTSTGPSGLVTRDQFLVQMTAAAPSLTGHTRIPTARTIAVDEGVDGNLDHVNIMWSCEKPNLYIDCLVVAQIA